ncbi:MBL fold metallo-hydrolase [Propionicicella superfundia]|uniref:MBL fold metallo-hydrolase n=1 Tax=Propionicicella superfundia TaxID=348582 RepID=UPI00041D42CE|nr:MBL fold metallo-hydrolase [Propionicicella superfundia]
MDITHLGHSAVLVETPDTRVLIDPGNMSDGWHGLTDLAAVLITHQHPDHVDPARLPALLAANPQARVLVEPSVVRIVADAGGEAEPVPAGRTLTVGGLTVDTVGGLHAVIHRDLSRIGNVGFVVRETDGPALFHPGDSLATVPDGVDILATPAYGPWAAMKETIDFVREVGASRGFLIHEGLLNERGWALSFGRLGEMTPTVYADLRNAGPASF